MSLRFTERAQRIIMLAQEVATRYQCDVVEPLHILAATMGLGEGIACQILAGSGLSIAAIKERALSEHPKRGSALMGEIPFSPDGRKILEFAVSEAQCLAHNFVGTEHLLLGLLLSESSSRLLKEYGLETGGVREGILRLIGKGSYPPHGTISDLTSFLGEQLMMISIAPDVNGVLVIAESKENKDEPGIVILLDEGADLGKTYKSLEAILPRVRHLSFKKPGKKPVSWIEGRWQEHPDAEPTLIF